MTSLDHVQLPDGRSLDVRVSGPSDGLAVVFHHGTPGARTPFRAIERAAHERGLRIVTMSRAGYGGSHRHAGRRVVDVVADTAAVLDALRIEHCAVAGWSGGGPHALACAARLEAAATALVIAGVAPYDSDDLDWMAGMGEENVTEFSRALLGEDALRAFLSVAATYLREVPAQGIVGALSTLLADVDKEVLTDEFGQDMAASIHEAIRVSVDGWLDDDLSFVSPWGFELAEIDIPVAIWQGSADLMVPFAHGQWLANHVPGATAHLLDGEGHLSIAIGALPGMLEELSENSS